MEEYTEYWTMMLEERWANMSTVQVEIERKDLLKDLKLREEDYEGWLKKNNFIEEVYNGIPLLVKSFPIYTDSIIKKHPITGDKI